MTATFISTATPIPFHPRKFTFTAHFVEDLKHLFGLGLDVCDKTEQRICNSSNKRSTTDEEL